MPKLAASLTALLSIAPHLDAQGAAAPAPSAFEKQLLATMKRHPFFKDVSFEVEAKRAPFLFFVQAPLRRDEKNFVNLVVNGVQAHLGELLRLFDETYCKPNGITMRADAQQVAIAVLASRGLYDDYARATQDAFLHQSLAHYNHDLRLAVTYRAGFGAGDQNEQRSSLLHEVVHVLQHAYSKTGDMPKPMWFNEGLAEYRSSSTHIAATLAEPPMLEEHLEWLLFACAHPEGKKLMLPIADLVTPETYAQVVEVARQRAGQMVDGNAVLGMFYAQSEMFVRFLHEGADRKYLPGFLRYFAAVEGGAGGLEAFRTAFSIADDAAMGALESDWRAWLTKAFERRLGFAVDLETGKGLERHAMTPPTDFDPSTLAWHEEELSLRLCAVHRLCAQGELERAAGLLPAHAGADPAMDARLRREREALQALSGLRDKLVAEQQKKGTAELGGEKGKVLRREGDDVILATKGGEVRVRPRPADLLAFGTRAKAFQFANCWQEVWLRWLCGETRASMSALLAREYSRLADLRADLTDDLTPDYGVEALALERFQQMTMPADRDGARAMLAELRQVAAKQGPLFTRRRAAVDQLATALAERAFDLDDADALGIHGKLERLPDGRAQILYDDAAAAPNGDFTAMENPPVQFVDPSGLAYAGPTCVMPHNGNLGAVGKGFLQWAMPVVGKQEISFDFQLPGMGCELVLLFCVAPGRHLGVMASGRLVVSDNTVGIHDEIGVPGVTIGEPHSLRVEHDGLAKVRVLLDGRVTAEASAVGNCLGGTIVLGVRSSTPVPLRNLRIVGKLDPSDPGAIRARYVATVLAGLWQTNAKVGAVEADATGTPDGKHAGRSVRERRLAKLEDDAKNAAELAIRWLVAHQDDDGRWDADAFMKHDRDGAPCGGPGDAMHDVGATALALLALSAVGTTGQSGVHKAAFRRGVDWLASQQNLTNGMFVPDLAARRIYDHAIATLAMAEAAEFSGEDAWRRAAQEGIRCLDAHRNPYSVFGYGARDGNNSMSLTAWCLEAYSAAQSLDLQLDANTLKLIATFYDQVSDPSGNHGYSKMAEPSSRDSKHHADQFPVQRTATLPAAGLFGRYLLGQTPKDQPVMNAAADLVGSRAPEWNPRQGTVDECYCYFGSLAMHLHGGATGKRWRSQLVAMAVGAQCRDGSAAGSWDPVGAWSSHGGRVCTTALMALSLLAPTRYERPVR